MQAVNSRIQEKSHLLSLQLPPRPSFAVKSGVSLITSCHARRWRWLRVQKLHLILWLQQERLRKFLQNTQFLKTSRPSHTLRSSHLKVGGSCSAWERRVPQIVWYRNSSLYTVLNNSRSLFCKTAYVYYCFAQQHANEVDYSKCKYL